MDDDRTFTVATDSAVISLIESAKRRLVVIAPALSRAVADALAARFDELEHLDIRVIVDADAEVYRLGFGEREALEVIRDAASRNLLDLRVQPGVRIGVIISDEDTMVFAPVSKNIEAGSDTAEKPNAIVLRGASTEKLVRASGAHANDESLPARLGMQRWILPKLRQCRPTLNETHLPSSISRGACRYSRRAWSTLSSRSRASRLAESRFHFRRTSAP